MESSHDHVCTRLARPASPARRGYTTLFLILVLLVVVACLAAWGMSRSGSSSTDGWLPSIPEGIVSARAERRPMLVLFTADWCPPCRRLKKEVLADADVTSYLEGQYVRVKIDLSERGGPNDQVAFELGVRSIPALHVYDPDGNQISIYQGEHSTWSLLDWLRKCRGWVKS